MYYLNQDLMILDTLSKKGHSERIMLMSRKHIKNPNSGLKSSGAKKFKAIARKLFEYDGGYYICEPTYATIPDHWHLIATNELSNDWKEKDQFEKTPKTYYKIKRGNTSEN